MSSYGGGGEDIIFLNIIDYLFYIAGNDGITGAGLPPNPVTTSAAAGAPNPVLLPKPDAGAETGALPKPPPLGAPKPVGAVGWMGAGGVYVVPPVGGAMPPLLAPFSFSCVRP